MELLEITNGTTVTPSPYLLQIEYFKLLKQSTKSDEEFIKILTYIYYIAHPMSPYRSYTRAIQETKIIEHLFNGKPFVPSVTVKKCIEIYSDLIKTKAERSLEVMRDTIDRIVDFYSNLDLTLVDKMGRPRFDVNTVTNAVGNFGKTYEALKKLEEQVKQDISNVKIRGGTELNEFNK